MKFLSCILTFILLVGCLNNLHSQNTTRVFVFTDINIDSGDPDDRQSLVHLLWYANELRIEGVVPERWNASGLEACELVAEAYAKDYFEYNFKEKNYPEPEKIERLFATGREDAI
ncbi:MAG: nucleoside hydrolase-like domain-containing protein, partial [Tangfeifania sp.]